MAVGPDLRPGTLLAAYRRGIFPWPHEEDDGTFVVAWWSPNPRAVFPLEAEPHWSRSLRRTLRKHPYRVSVDEAFEQVMSACGERRSGTWITPEMLAAYTELHRLGWAHSVEVWEREGKGDGPRATREREPGERLVGGIYGVAIGGLFAGESMFHRVTDASKIAFAELVRRLRAAGYVLFDVQVMTEHLASLGCVEVPRGQYLDRLAKALGRSPEPLA
jgi:leucyl/phenylalanyl-tRNA--protein transferase